MSTYERALDDYLHVIARIRPWTLEQHERLLTGLAEWWYEVRGAAPRLQDIDVEVARAYAHAEALSPDEAEALTTALHRLYANAVREELIGDNPFAVANRTSTT